MVLAPKKKEEDEKKVARVTSVMTEQYLVQKLTWTPSFATRAPSSDVTFCHGRAVSAVHGPTPELAFETGCRTSRAGKRSHATEPERPTDAEVELPVPPFVENRNSV